KVLYAHWEREGRELPPLRSAYRYLARHGYDRRSLQSGRLESGPKKAFASAYVNELWMVDFSPGPTIRTAEGKVLRPQLCVLIDDASRLMPFAAYYPNGNTEGGALPVLNSIQDLDDYNVGVHTLPHESSVTEQ
ncbi:MAG: hypothetical protein R6U20_11315, partial [Longimonas sp.]